MMKTRLLITAILLISLLFSSCSDTKNNKQQDGTDREVLSAADSGIVSDGWIAEAKLPQSTEILDWYEVSKARELIPYALLYSKDEADGKWHCWLYIGTWQSGDTLTLGRLDADGFCVTMDYATEATDPALGAAGAFHFSFSFDGEPSFEFSVNGDTDGLISTISDVSVAP